MTIHRLRADLEPFLTRLDALYQEHDDLPRRLKWLIARGVEQYVTEQLAKIKAQPPEDRDDTVIYLRGVLDRVCSEAAREVAP